MMKKNNNSSFANEFDLDKGYPLQLLSINYSNNDFFLNPKFSQIFKKDDSNIAFISIIGSKKSGKSFLLNRILGLEDSEGFRVGGFSDGVWLWTSPLYLEKENIYIYFLEFEGFSEYETSSIVEEKLMMIAMTLSSTVLIMTNQDYEDDIQKLISLLSFYHENIKLSDENEDIQNFQPPHFFWILREKENFSRKYKLNLDKLSLSKDEESNAIIKTLRNEAEIIWFDNIIRDSINNLREKILRKSQKKEIAGSILTSKIFANLISLMIKNLNENKILEIGKMIKSFLEKEFALAYDEAIQGYGRLKINESLNEEDLCDLLKETFQNALTIYMDRTLPLNNRFPEIYSDFLTKLKDYAANNERKIKIHSQETLSAKAYNKLKTLSINLFNQINSGVYHQDSNDLIKAITKTIQEYDESFISTDIKFQNFKVFLPDLLHKTFEAIRKYDKQQKIILKDSPTFFSEKKARSEIKSKALFESEISKTKDNTSFQFQKLNEDLIIENERLRSSLIEKDKQLKKKEEIIKNLEESKKTVNSHKKPTGCFKTNF